VHAVILLAVTSQSEAVGAGKKVVGGVMVVNLVVVVGMGLDNP